MQGVSPLLWEVPWEAAQGVLTVLQGALLGANTSVELVAEPSALGISSNQAVLGAGTMDRGQIQIDPGTYTEPAGRGWSVLQREGAPATEVSVPHLTPSLTQPLWAHCLDSGMDPVAHGPARAG